MPGRASGAHPLRRNQARARARLQLEGRARRCAALARPVRQSVLAGDRRPRRQGRNRLGHLRRARNVPCRRQWHDPLEARRPAQRRDHRRRAAAGAAAHRRRTMKRWLLVVVLALASFAGLLPATARAQVGTDVAPLQFNDAAEERRFHALVSELRCVMCQNQSLSDSNAQIAHDLRREVLGLMRAGRSDAEVKDFLVARYGEFVLYRPRMTGKTWLLWLGPALLLVVGGMVIARIVRRRSDHGTVVADDEQEW